ncbi:MAG: CPBP family intramembrane metalloprotease [Gemmatimonadetes bacterium]|nr:CPBP family intramembrane metalloprotease [Gemmatimonadota bacterium]
MRGMGSGPDGGAGPEGQGGGRVGRPWLIHGAMGALLVTALGLHLRLDVALPAALLTGFLVFVLPFFSVAQLSAIHDGPMDRPGVYAGSAVVLVLLTMVALVVGAFGPGLGSMGLGAVDSTALGVATLRLGAATAGLLLVFHLVAKVARIPESDLLKQLLPRTGHERRLFAGLSCLAGFGEEVVFRGFLLAVLTPALGDPWTALLASSLAFGVLHVYQGSFGILRTAMLGALLGASVIVDGTLWPAVLVHALVDLVGGLVVGPRMVRELENLPDASG